METIHDENVIALCTAFVNRGDAEPRLVGCEVEDVMSDGHNINIIYRFPCSTGWKSSQWTITHLELMGWMWVNK